MFKDYGIYYFNIFQHNLERGHKPETNIDRTLNMTHVNIIKSRSAAATLTSSKWCKQGKDFILLQI